MARPAVAPWAPAAPRAAETGREVPAWLPWALRVIAVVLGAAHAWTGVVQQSMSEDGISYLDMGDAYLRGDWGSAVNTTWSPLYAWVLGAALRMARPSIAWEFAVVQAVNFGLYLFALACFEVFWREASRMRRAAAARDGALVGLPEWAWTLLGYSLFIWCSLSLIRVWVVTPDLLMTALLFLAATLLLRVILDGAGWRAFIALGAVLGIAYLAKAAMFPLAFVFLALALLAGGGVRHAAPSVLAAGAVFLLIAGPYVALLSTSKGRATFGDAGRLTYLRMANGVPYPHWPDGVDVGVGLPAHPARQIFDAPRVFEFATPVAGTYPLSYDPSYWYEGVTPRLDPRAQLAVLASSSGFYFDVFVRQAGGLIAVAALLLLAAPGAWRARRPTAAEWSLIAVAFAAFAMYALVYIQTRYVAGFVLLFWTAVFAAVRLPDRASARRLLRVGGAVAAGSLWLNIIAFNADGLTRIAGLDPPRAPPAEPRAPAYRPVQMAEAVLAMGIQQGDEIGYIGWAFEAFFARLARLRIVVEMPLAEVERFWAADAGTRSAVVDAIRRTGVRAIVAESIPSWATAEGWERVGHSRHFLYRFR